MMMTTATIMCFMVVVVSGFFSFEFFMNVDEGGVKDDEDKDEEEIEGR